MTTQTTRPEPSTPKKIVRRMFVWLFMRPFLPVTAFGYWIGGDSLTYWQCIKKLWKEPL